MGQRERAEVRGVMDADEGAFTREIGALEQRIRDSDGLASEKEARLAALEAERDRLRMLFDAAQAKLRTRFNAVFDVLDTSAAQSILERRDIPIKSAADDGIGTGGVDRSGAICSGACNSGTSDDGASRGGACGVGVVNCSGDRSSANPSSANNRGAGRKGISRSSAVLSSPDHGGASSGSAKRSSGSGAAQGNADPGCQSGGVVPSRADHSGASRSGTGHKGGSAANKASTARRRHSPVTIPVETVSATGGDSDGIRLVAQPDVARRRKTSPGASPATWSAAVQVIRAVYARTARL